MLRLISIGSLVAAALLASVGAQAAGIVLSWQAPTQNIDGTAIPATGTTALQSYLVDYGLCNADGSYGTTTATLTITAPTISATIPSPPTGTVCVRVSAKNNAGATSDPSTTASEVWPPPAPARPKPPVINSVK